MAKPLTYLVIHCTATPEGRPVSAADIRRWHTGSKLQGGRGWRQVGYADMIHQNGEVENLVPYNNDNKVDAWEITNGAKGINSISRHVVYVGGVEKTGNRPKDTRTQKQLDALKKYVLNVLAQHPEIKIVGHDQFAPKACPSFDVPKWLKSIGVNDINIYNN